jgi:hypothetical protein
MAKSTTKVDLKSPIAATPIVPPSNHVEEGPRKVAVESISLAWPLPSDLPVEALADALFVVAARTDRGRRRAGFAFGREETVIPFSDLTDEQRDAIAFDPQLDAHVRLVKPSKSAG